MFLDNRIMTAINTTNETTMAINEVIIELPKNTKDTIKAATEMATPNP